MNTCKKLFGAVCIAALPASLPAEALPPAAPLRTVEVQLLATDQQGNPLFASPAGTGNRPIELSWTICVQQEDACRQEAFTRQWRVSLPAGTHKVTLRVLCPAGGAKPQRWMLYARTFTVAGNAPATGSKVVVAAQDCPQGRAQ